MSHRALNRRLLLGLTAVVVVGLFGLGQIGHHLLSAGAADARIEIWHGAQQKVGHLGNGQPDFNLMGRVEDPQNLLALQYTLNDSIPVELNFRAYRRLAMDGHFNADIPIAALAPGRNTIEVQGRYADAVARQTVTLERLSGASPLPVRIDWSGVSDPQDVGQYVDGHWRVGEDGLRPAHLGYDRLFLIGDETWQDYEITAIVKIHEVTPETGPLSGGNGLGVVLRFTGHVIGGPRRFPIAQPKWGYQPFGAIAWLRWKRGDADGAAFRQFHPGDSKETANYGKVEVRPGETYVLKALCQTLPDDEQGRGVTRYAFKFWPAAADEPQAWDWQEVQASRDALRHGGVALLAHHVDASFGDISIVPLA
ncbi:MAG: hypothetical protein ACREIR_01570, partial [Geminicoccaceae bacterium]